MQRRLRFLAGASVILALSVPYAHSAGTPASASPLATMVVQATSTAGLSGYEGVVEAVNQVTLAAQVPGAVVALAVKAGDAVKAGQVLLRIDARAADQQAAAAAAQATSAQAAQDLASREFERQKALHAKQYISDAALERAEAQYKAARAQAAAQIAAAGAASTASGFHTVRAPYAGVVSEVSVMLGDMAMPGRPLVTLYDPGALRVSAAVPQGAVAATSVAPQVELPGLSTTRIAPVHWRWLPAVDPVSHTQQLRAELPATPGLSLVPGTFARVWLPSAATATPRLLLPSGTLIRRGEIYAVYVVGDDGRALLRQVRIGDSDGTSTEIISGLRSGERVAVDPQAAARVHP